MIIKWNLCTHIPLEYQVLGERCKKENQQGSAKKRPGLVGNCHVFPLFIHNVDMGSFFTWIQAVGPSGSVLSATALQDLPGNLLEWNLVMHGLAVPLSYSRFRVFFLRG